MSGGKKDLEGEAVLVQRQGPNDQRPEERQAQSSAFGLSLDRDIVALTEGGTASTESSPSSWTESRPGTSPEGAPGEPHRALIIVEENVDEFLLLRRAFSKIELAAAVLWAPRGVDALGILAHLRADVNRVCVVSETKLPDMDAFELVRAVKASRADAQIRFVFLTGRSQPATEDRAYACGADGFFRKSVRTDDLFAVAKELQKQLGDSPD